jgi:hypothetical protein
MYSEGLLFYCRGGREGRGEREERENKWSFIPPSLFELSAIALEVGVVFSTTNLDHHLEV